MKKRIVMFFWGGIFPVSMGNRRVTYEISKYLHSLPDVRLELVIVGTPCSESADKYSRICSDVHWIPMPRRWSLIQVFNKIGSRCQIDVFQSFFTALQLRKKFLKIAENADGVILNYSFWFPLITRNLRRYKTLVITHDLLFYRRASFKGTNTPLKRAFVSINKYFELLVLQAFMKIGVFARYEEELLLQNGISHSKIMRLGMPIGVEVCSFEKKLSDIKYDFIFVAGDSPQNEMGIRCFLERVVPLIAPRKISVVVVGGICGASFWKTLNIPDFVCINRVGYVNDLNSVFKQALIGIGTLPCGSGIKVKVVETALHGLPMIVTNSGAEGIPLNVNAAINIDELSEDSCRTRLLQWLDNPVLTLENGKNGARTVGKHFNPHHALVCLKKWSDELTGRA